MIKTAEDFSRLPGGRYAKDGPFSGEEFRRTILEPAYAESLSKGEKLVIDMDGCYGFAPAFLDESFGVLACKYSKNILKNITIICYDELGITDSIERSIKRKINKGGNTIDKKDSLLFVCNPSGYIETGIGRLPGRN